jgi:O-antigen/teichoic acid export membrane protein
MLLPLYAKHLTISDYGILGIIEVSTQLLTTVFGLSLYQAFFRWYWDNEFIDKQKSIFFTSMFFLVLISILIYLGFNSFTDKFSILLFGKIDYSYLLKIMVISAGLQIIAIMPLTLMRLQEKPILYSSTNIIKLIVSFAFTIYFIVSLNRKIEGIYEAQIISYFVFFVISSKYIWKNIKLKFEVKILKEMLSFSLPLVFASISGTILSIADRYCLKFLGNLSEVGIYSLGFKMANTIKVFVVASVNLAISPIIFKMMDKPENKRFYSKIMTYFTFVVMICILGMSFFGKEIIKLLARNRDYWDAYKVIPIISFAILFGMLKDTSLIGINIMKKTKILAIIIFLMSITNIILNIIFIPYFQSIGAAFATLITQFIFFLIVYKYSQKYYYISFEIKKIIKMIGIGIVLFGISLLTNELNLFFRIILKTSLLFSFPIILYFLNFYEEIELLRLKQGWIKWRDPRKWRNNFEK